MNSVTLRTMAVENIGLLALGITGSVACCVCLCYLCLYKLTDMQSGVTRSTTHWPMVEKKYRFKSRRVVPILPESAHSS